jgi:hypothetical protein
MLDEESQPELFGSRKRTGRLARERRTKLCPFTVYFIHPFLLNIHMKLQEHVLLCPLFSVVPSVVRRLLLSPE